MAIYNPEPFLSSVDRELLGLLSQLVLEQEQGWTGNRDRDFTELTNAEAQQLLRLLEDFIGTKRFIESTYLIESVFSGSEYDDRRLKEIFLRWRKFHGKTRAVATVQWRDFLMRLGAIPSEQANARYWYRASARPMDLDHFYRMEARLADAAGLHVRVRELILAYVRLQFTYVDRVRAGAETMNAGQIADKPKSLIKTLKLGQGSQLGQKPIPTTKIAEVMTIVMDLSSLYTTRDWSVASILSTVAGASPSAILD